MDGTVLNLYSIKDIVADEYSAPVPYNTDAQAARWFNLVLSKADINRQDYQLYRVGTWQPSNGGIVGSFPKLIDTVLPEVNELPAVTKDTLEVVR